MDIVDQLFEDLPRPRDLLDSPNDMNLIEDCYDALEEFLVNALYKTSAQPEFAFLQSAAEKAIRNSNICHFQDRLGILTLQYPPATRGQGIKAEYFRYCHWLIKGRCISSIVPRVDGAVQPNNTISASTRSYSQEENTVARALSVFQSLFLEVLQATYPCRLLSIETTTNTVVAYHDDWESVRDKKRCLMKKHWQFQFPMNTARLAVLTKGCCGMVLTAMKPLFDLLLGPFFKKVEDVDFMPKNVGLLVQLVYEHGSSYNTTSAHYVVRATMHSGQQFAIDCTGAQFGWPEIMMPWDEYEARRLYFTQDISIIKPGPWQPTDPEHRKQDPLTVDLVKKLTTKVEASLRARWSDGVMGLVKAPRCTLDKYHSNIVTEARGLLLFQSILSDTEDICYPSLSV